MLRLVNVILVSMFACGMGVRAQSQVTPAPEEDGSKLRLVIAPATHSSDSVLAIPAEVSWSGKISLGVTSTQAPKASGNIAKFISSESSLNGLYSPELLPWHLVVSYDQFDEEGDKVHSGTFEEFWVGPKKFKTTYKSDNLAQTDYGTDKGLFRLGDQRWPSRDEMAVRDEIVAPFSYAATLQTFRLSQVDRNFSGHLLDCSVLENISGISNPTQYCFAHGGTALRYSRGFGWQQTVYNDLVHFQGRSVGRDVEVTDGGKPHLKLHVQLLEMISSVHDDEFLPPGEAVKLSGGRIRGVNPKAVLQPFPEWPSSLLRKHFTVTIAVVIGKNGHVIEAHALDGPSEAFKAAEDDVRKWVFQPYLVMGEPEEAETKIMLSNN